MLSNIKKQFKICFRCEKEKGFFLYGGDHYYRLCNNCIEFYCEMGWNNVKKCFDQDVDYQKEMKKDFINYCKKNNFKLPEEILFVEYEQVSLFDF